MLAFITKIIITVDYKLMDNVHVLFIYNVHNNNMS